MFKKLITSTIMASLMALTIPFAATSVEASTGCTCRNPHRYTSRARSRRRTYRRNYATYSNGYSDSYANGYTASRTAYVAERRPSYYSRHRRLVNTGLGAAAGAVIGGLIGGRRGAGLGILAGGAGSQVYTHYQRPRNYTRTRSYTP